MQVIFKNASRGEATQTFALKPLCPTRWTVRSNALRSVVNQYESIIEALEEMSRNPGNASTRAAGLLVKFQKGVTLLALLIALVVIEPLENLNRSLQGLQSTVGGNKMAIASVNRSLTTKRENGAFELLFTQATKLYTN